MVADPRRVGPAAEELLRGFAQGKGCDWSECTKTRQEYHTQFPQDSSLAPPAQVSGEGTWLLNSAGIFSPALRNAVSSPQPRLCVFLSSWLCPHQSLHEAGCKRGADCPSKHRAVQSLAPQDHLGTIICSIRYRVLILKPPNSYTSRRQQPKKEPGKSWKWNTLQPGN